MWRSRAISARFALAGVASRRRAASPERMGGAPGSARLPPAKATVSGSSASVRKGMVDRLVVTESLKRKRRRTTVVTTETAGVYHAPVRPTIGRDELAGPSGAREDSRIASARVDVSG